MCGGVRRSTAMPAERLGNPTGRFDVATRVWAGRSRRLRGARDVRMIDGWEERPAVVGVGRLHPRPPV